MPDKLTDNDIVKALEDWIKNYDGLAINFIKLGNALELINHKDEELNRLQAENKRLSTLAELGNTRANDYRVMRDRALKAEAEIERLKLLFESVINSRDGYIKVIEQYKAENERLKEEIELLHSDYTYKLVKKKAKAEAYKEFAERLKGAKQYSVERHEKIVPVAVIDWILKELVSKNE